MGFLRVCGGLRVSLSNANLRILFPLPSPLPQVLEKLRDVMPDIVASEVYRTALWLLGQYSLSDEEVQAALHCIRECIGPLPLVQPWDQYAAQMTAAAAAEKESAAAAAAETAGAGATTKAARKPAVLADGTYATQSAITAPEAKAGAGSGVDGDYESILPSLRRLLLGGDFFLSSVVASTLTKLALRVSEHHGREARHTKGVMIDAMLVMCAIMELGASGLAGTPALLPAAALPANTNGRGGAGAAAAAAAYKALPLSGVTASGNIVSDPNAPGQFLYAPMPGTGAAVAPGAPAAGFGPGVTIDQDSFERVTLCMRVLGDPTATAAALPVLLHACKDTFHSLLVERRARAAQAAKDGVQSTGQSLMNVSSAASSASSGDAANKDASSGPSALAACDDPLSIRLLRPNRGAIGEDALIDDDVDVGRAAGSSFLMLCDSATR